MTPATLQSRQTEGKNEGTLMNRAKAALWLFAGVSIISFIVALIPVVKGNAPNGALLFSGIIWLVLAIATARKTRTDRSTPPAA